MPSKRSLGAQGLALGALGGLGLVWPGDAPWLFDEPRFFHAAMEHLRAGTIAAFGLPGTRGFDMGPFPVWVDCVLLALTRDLTVIVLLRAALFAAAAALSLVWLSRSCRTLNPAFGVIAMASFYLWFYSRILWDTFYFPLSALTIAAYVSFCVRREPWKLALVALGCLLLFLTHLMGMVVVLPLVSHALWLHRRWLFDRPALLAAVAALALALGTPYLAHLLLTPKFPIDLPSYSFWKGWLFPFFGCRLFSAAGLDYFLDADWTRSPFLHAAGAATLAAYPLAFAGMVLSARTAAAGWRDPGRRDGDFFMGTLALASLTTQCAVFGRMRAYDHPHYFGPGWLFSFYFIWSALSAAETRFKTPSRVLAGVYGLSLLAVQLGAITAIHRTGGNRSIHYGTTLANQIEVARSLEAFRPGPLDLQVLHYKLSPEALRTLTEIYGIRGDTSAPARRLAVVYQDPGSRDGRIKLVAED